MTHPYQSRTRNRDRSLASPAASCSSGPVAWIVAIGFIFILACVAYPVFQALLERGQ
jgi:hypothetical protein